MTGIATLTFHSTGATLDLDSKQVTTIECALEFRAQDFAEVAGKAASDQERSLFAEQSTDARTLFESIKQVHP